MKGHAGKLRVAFSGVPTTKVFQEGLIPLSQFEWPSWKAANTSFTVVPEKVRLLFKNFTVQDWSGFNAQASRVLAGTGRERTIRQNRIIQFQGNWEDSKEVIPNNEAGLTHKFSLNLNIVVDGIRKDLRGDGTRWVIEPSVSSRGTPDFGLQKEGSKEVIAVGEVKTPELNLQLTPSDLTTLMYAEDSLKNTKLLPYWQLFWDAVHSNKGVGYLSNYDETRFFKMDLARRIIYMSPLVRINQPLVEGQQPHPVQAVLFLEETPDRPNFTKELRKQLETKANDDAINLRDRREAEQKKEADAEKKAEKDKKTNAKSKGSSSKDREKSHSQGDGEETENFDTIECNFDVPLLLLDSKHVQTLGSGLAGDVEEYEYEGKRIAVKAGLICHGSIDREIKDMGKYVRFEHVKNEIEIYELLEEVQGVFVPKVIAAGRDTICVADGMVLITEKVGIDLFETEEDGLYVEDTKLSDENVRLVKKKAKEGLKAIHGCGVVHGDPRAANMRVEMKGGKVDRVWWIDFGLGLECDSENEWKQYVEMDEMDGLFGVDIEGIEDE